MTLPVPQLIKMYPIYTPMPGAARTYSPLALGFS